MSHDLEESLRQAATAITLPLAPEDEQALRRLDRLRRWLRATPPPEAAGSYLLVLGRKGETSSWRPLRGCRLSVGRDAAADLVLDSKRVSRLHCVLESDGADWSVRDTDSTNGVAVNGNRCALAWLVSGDTLHLGDFHLLFLCVPAVELPEPGARQAIEPS
jgi:hypothetical protein